MPTTRPRHTITETEDLARALDAAARIWPEIRDDRTLLLRRVLARGLEAVELDDETRRVRRLAAIRAGAGSMTGIYPPGEADRLRNEWPE